MNKNSTLIIVIILNFILILISPIIAIVGTDMATIFQAVFN